MSPLLPLGPQPLLPDVEEPVWTPMLRGNPVDLYNAWWGVEFSATRNSNSVMTIDLGHSTDDISRAPFSCVNITSSLVNISYNMLQSIPIGEQSLLVSLGSVSHDHRTTLLVPERFFTSGKTIFLHYLLRWLLSQKIPIMFSLDLKDVVLFHERGVYKPVGPPNSRLLVHARKASKSQRVWSLFDVGDPKAPVSLERHSVSCPVYTSRGQPVQRMDKGDSHMSGIKNRKRLMATISYTALATVCNGVCHESMERERTRQLVSTSRSYARFL